jgi:flagellin-like protein
MKGISPLIASVLLIAFTMTIAGLMAAWAQSWTGTRLSSTQCALTLTVDDLRFENDQIIIAIRNNNNKVNLTDLRGYTFYSDVTKNTNYILKDYGADDPLAPLMGTTAVINTTSSTKPQRIRIVSGTCPDTPADGYF